MRVIGAGLPRTGTLSQKVALETLGLGRCYHMVDVLGNLDLVSPWRAALDGQGRWKEIFDGYGATVDWPGSFFYRELLDVYPEAKVLLSVRDGEAWAASMRTTIWEFLYGDGVAHHLSAARAAVDPGWRAYTELMRDMWARSGLLSQDDASAERLGARMERYNQEVRETVRSERLLVWTAADGWEPLCAFLELPVPDTSFPRVNDSKQFADRMIDGSLEVLTQWRAQER